MSLSKETIRDFQRIIEKEYGVKYTDEEAREAAENLVGFFEILMKADYKSKGEKA
ncbi:MAG: hypothetical protein AAB966_03650 [Patescibacteria group bacterium]